MPSTEKPVDPSLDPELDYSPVFHLLLKHHGIDFTFYRRSTIGRRIERRATLNNTSTPAEYMEKLEENPEELELLYKDLLIGVTEFFRDKEAIDTLAAMAVPGILEKKEPEEEIRIWVAGCATGEEAYTIAIALMEQIDQLPEPRNFKVFATDVHQHSLDVASAGVYSSKQLEKLGEELREKYFTHCMEGWRANKHLRHKLVFAKHDLLRDAPFTKMDLLVCRNVLIYFEPKAQDRVLETFQYALATDGILFLGPSENVGQYASNFVTLDSRWKIFCKHKDSVPTLPPRLAGTSFPTYTNPARWLPVSLPSMSGPSPRLMQAYDQLLEEHMPPGILLNELFEIVHIFGDAGRYLSQPAGRQSNQILARIDKALQAATTAALQKVSQEHAPAIYDGLPFESEGETLHVRLGIKPMFDQDAESAFYLLTLDSRQSENGKSPVDGVIVTHFDNNDATNEQIKTLEAELHYTREHLQTTVEELQSSNEELQSTNEELVASNEELHTVNSEYEQKISEMTQLTEDMDNLLASTEIGVIYLDRDMHIRHFTPTVADFFHLIDRDIGRPIAHITGQIPYENLAPAAEKVLSTQEMLEREVSSPEGKPFLMRILPYRTGSQSVDGIIIAFIDIDQLKSTELELRETARKLNETNEELSVFNKMTVGRELAMIELKKEINDLLNASGKPPKYDIPD